MRFLAIVCALAAAALAQVAKDANSRYQTKEGRAAVAKGLSRADRDAEQKPAELIAAMGIRPGMTVADIGTGTGYMLPWLSKAVGPAGRVLAEDVFDDFLDQARAYAAAENLKNVTFIKGSFTDPSLPEGSVDLVLALDSYHHYDYPDKMLAGFHRALKPGGHLVLVEYYRRPEAMTDALHHIRLDAPGVIQEVEAAHFHFLSQRDQIKDRQYMATFEPQ